VSKKFLIIPIILILTFVSLSAEGRINFFLTDNILNSSDKMMDVGLDFDYSYKYSSKALDVSANIGVYSPLVYYSLFSIPYSLMIQYTPLFTMNRMFFTGAYLYNMAYFGDYYENNVLTPGVFADYKEYAGKYFILKPSLEVWSRYFPFAKDMSSVKGEASLKTVLNIPAGMSVHFNGLAGVSRSLYEAGNTFKFEVSPLLSVNLFGKLGLSISYTTGKIVTDKMLYYEDDSFTDKYYYAQEGYTAKATLPMSSGGYLSGGYSSYKRDFSPLEYIAATDSAAAGYIEDRTDNISTVFINLLAKSEGSSYNLNYKYEMHTSTNSIYNYSSNYLSFGFDF